ncbi:hypothetical protein NUW54_g11893 [Trametes sanguinea]|uniref:Uncharacterized protein n=1 Tax=Trametes sanguinea TaxID=158606 RepID=A0ACC1N593_9APHY|nr:hypothetical protein NUW54_g11893 [Trametes sanguinea]
MSASLRRVSLDSLTGFLFLTIIAHGHVHQELVRPHLQLSPAGRATPPTRPRDAACSPRTTTTSLSPSSPALSATFLCVSPFLTQLRRP